MNLIAWFLHLALAIVPPQTTAVTIDCSTIPPEAPPVASCWKPPVVTPRPPSVTTVATVPPTVATTSPMPPALVTGCRIKAGSDVCESRQQITEANGNVVSSIRIVRVP